MSTPDQLLIALQPCQKIQAELHQDDIPLQLTAEISTPESPINRVTVPKDGSLLLGFAEDGLPLMLDLYDPAPGPLLVAGDGGSGKTAFIQSLAQASDLQNPGEIQFGVLTPFPEEWAAQECLPNCLGIWPAYHPGARTFLSQMISWAEVLPGSHQAVVVLLDGLDLITSGAFHVLHELRWLLLYGPQQQVRPVVTVNPGRLNRLIPWLDFFQTRVLGQVKLQQTARLLVGDPEIDFSALLPGRQFSLSRPQGWLKFWLPSVEQEGFPYHANSCNPTRSRS
jgi:hypothetical protein